MDDEEYQSCSDSPSSEFTHVASLVVVSWACPKNNAHSYYNLRLVGTNKLYLHLASVIQFSQMCKTSPGSLGQRLDSMICCACPVHLLSIPSHRRKSSTNSWWISQTLQAVKQNEINNDNTVWDGYRIVSYKRVDWMDGNLRVGWGIEQLTLLINMAQAVSVLSRLPHWQHLRWSLLDFGPCPAPGWSPPVVFYCVNDSALIDYNDVFCLQKKLTFPIQISQTFSRLLQRNKARSFFSSILISSNGFGRCCNASSTFSTAETVFSLLLTSSDPLDFAPVLAKWPYLGFPFFRLLFLPTLLQNIWSSKNVYKSVLRGFCCPR